MITFEPVEEFGQKYLSYQVQPEDIIDQVTLEMLDHNEFSNLVPFSTFREGGEVYYRYNITGLKRLREFNLKVINKNNLLKVLKGIQHIIEDCQNHLIPITQIIIDDEFFFFENDGICIKFIVSPIENEVDDINRKLLKTIQSMKLGKKDEEHIVSIWNYFETAGSFSLSDFSKLIDSIENGNRDNFEDDTNDDDIFAEDYDFGPIGINGKPKEVVVEHDVDVPVSKEPYSGKIGVLHKLGGKLKFTKEKGNIKDESQDKNKKKTKEKSKKESKERAGSGKYKILDVKIPDIVNKNDKPSDDEKVPEKKEVFVDNEIDLDSHHVDEEDFEETAYEEEQGFKIDAEEDIDSTVSYSLHRISTGEIFEIEKSEVKIGRKSSDVDIYIQGNNHVGRIHAYLYYDGEALRIEDNNSANGTFINNSRIMEVKELYAGDKLKLGDEEFVVK